MEDSKRPEKKEPEEEINKSESEQIMPTTEYNSLKAGEIFFHRGAAKDKRKNSRLSVMPLAVLLPQKGDLRLLRKMRDSLEDRLNEVQTDKVSYDEEFSKQLAHEESMINQVLQWLVIDGSMEN